MCLFDVALSTVMKVCTMKETGDLRSAMKVPLDIFLHKNLRKRKSFENYCFKTMLGSTLWLAPPHFIKYRFLHKLNPLYC